MSNKNEYCRARGNAKSGVTLDRVFGQRNGKVLSGVVLEIYDEMTPYPPATKEEVQAFLRVQIKRCNVNLANAKDRGDKRAVVNLTRKLAIHEYLEKLVPEQASSDGFKECPECEKRSVDIFGYCRCCGKRW